MIQRHLKPRLVEALAHFPVVAILGGRQVGKTTLAQDLPSKNWPARYLTLDDRAVLDAVLRDPDGFVDGQSLPVILDEVQRAPDLLRAVKRVVDRSRQPGMFLLTGSANLLTLQSLSETLAGRVALYELDPFSWAELHRQPGPPATVESLFRCGAPQEFLQSLPALEAKTSRAQLAARILGGGYPVPALMSPGALRAKWFESYRQTYLERDLREIANIVRLPDFARLLTVAASRTGQLLNVAEVSRDLGLPANTVRRHLGLLETTYQIRLIPPYFANITKRLVKTPKLFFNDTGLAGHLLAVDDWDTVERRAAAGALVETWVAAELRKLCALSSPRTELYFWRTHAGREVDFLVERGARLAAIEVKWSQRIGDADIAGLNTCRADLGQRLGLCIILHSGPTAFALNDHTVAVPLPLFFGHP